MEHHSLNYDVVIEGTGLPESILAAACAWSGKKVLHLDQLPFYGGCWAAFNLDEIQNTFGNDSPLRSEYNYVDLSIPEPDKLPPSRSCSLDLSPRLLYCHSEMTSLLITTKMSQYLEFKAFGNFVLYASGRYVKVPNGREDIFASEDLDLREKRKIMKFLKFASTYEEQENSDIIHEYADKPLLNLLSTFSLPPELVDSLIHVFASSPDKSILTSLGLLRIRNHLSSLSIYGPFPCLLPSFGGGCELAQAFCRGAAVKGAVYMLGATLNGSSLSNGDYISYKHRFRGVNRGLMSYQILLVKVDSEEKFFSNDASLIVFPPNSMGNKNSVTARVHGSGTGECPKGYINVYLLTKGDEIDVFDSIARTVLEKLQNSSVLLTLTYTFSHTTDATTATHLVNNLESPTYDDAIAEARRVYTKAFGEQDSFF